ncbi:hypothetical protein [Anaerotalea alkaliphila]|uniref:Uncharacterized protein n=1 Tax=Anaerotalea alkaliphila TaxID=2662126 RepID=A0A7X5HWM6_9FIRM|nr:hypothetical protein [Anaerotalea alkaliphila]NDL68008.1 hypothetical protein [Anaerotalea alkaliphila]
MELDYKFWIQILVYAGTFGGFYGSMKTEMRWMKEKLDKHNSFQDRLVRVEESGKSAHHRLDDLCNDMKR